MDFQKFKKEWQQAALNLLQNSKYVFQSEVPGQELWDTYIDSFPAEYKQENTCNACRSFIKQYGGMVVISKDYDIHTIWEVPVTNPAWQTVLQNMKVKVLSYPIKNVMELPKKLGTNYNYGPTLIKWEHLYLETPRNLLLSRRLADLHEYPTTKAVFQRGLAEISIEALKDVLALIVDNNLYRGSEYQAVVAQFLKIREEYDRLSAFKREAFLWLKTMELPASVSRLKNVAIGTLLVELSSGEDPEKAVASFERMMAPANYRRPTAVVTAGTLKKAEEQLAQMGLLPSLARRQAVKTDISVAHTLFTNRNRALTDIFAELQQDIQVDSRKLKAQEISLEEFLALLPQSTNAQLLLETRLQSNLVALITGVNDEAPSLFKWNNPISWSYTGGLGDSIRERVKKAGGEVNGRIRASLAWETYSDLDLHVYEPNRIHVYYGDKRSLQTGATLDVDMNAGGRTSRTPVENIIYPHGATLAKGTYKVAVKNYCDRELTNGFSVELEVEGRVYSFRTTERIKDGQEVEVVTFTWDGKEIKVVGNATATPATLKDEIVWSLTTNRFHNIELALFSPNYWEGVEIGNKHLFLILEGCKAEGELRGFLNEFLKEELNPHRKVLEALGSRLKVEEDPAGLAGVGFSLTQKGSNFFCKIDNKIYKVTI